ncbi:uncharacterized protein L199_005485 [Kwoniella botswanensis]|uniref:uncharacterized protein n=1 Tax=Kwoniella botswanensis TaxID=1268659 RepID=UPI00315C5F9F
MKALSHYILTLIGLTSIPTLASTNQSSITREITVKNSCKTTIWPGLHTGNETTIPNQITGWRLQPKQGTTFQVPGNWTAGRIWARTGCTIDESGLFVCLTGSCGNGTAIDAACLTTNDPPATLAEFTLSFDKEDNYDISLVDGYNLPLNIYPSDQNCLSPVCEGNVNKYCPPLLRTGLDKNGINLGCMAPCNAGFGDELYGNRACCTGAYGNDSMLCESCGMDYYDMFKDNCEFSYAYAYDEKSDTALHTCPATSLAGYTVEFCPNNSNFIGELEPDPKYLSSTASCSNIATSWITTFPIRPSPTQVLTSGTLDVVATVATGVDGAAAIRVDISSSTGTASRTGSSAATSSGQMVSIPTGTRGVTPGLPIVQHMIPSAEISVEGVNANEVASTTSSGSVVESSRSSGEPESIGEEDSASVQSTTSASYITSFSMTSTIQTEGSSPSDSIITDTASPLGSSSTIPNINAIETSPATSSLQSTLTRSHLVTITTTLPGGSSTVLSYAPTQGPGGYTSAFTVIDGNTLYQVMNGGSTGAGSRTCKAPRATATATGPVGQWLRAVPKGHTDQKKVSCCL